MRYIKESNAKLIEEVLEVRISQLKELPAPSLRLQNKIRLLKIALKELQTKKIVKNGRVKN
ncbi:MULTISPECIES: hypothetical protein [Prevotella]|jgi:hypothetical protein|uniref:hypothetical protein n=1 Tax=Prevotella TaxID=838 RepID=UPI000491D2F3|nr:MULTISPECIES: hypothetical protein [Prevotella]KXU57031.1 hypothetical protein HMPREF3218_0201684 [Prevotella bivia]